MLTCVSKKKVESYPSITGFGDRKGKRGAKEAAGQGNKGDRASKLLRQVVCASEHA